MTDEYIWVGKQQQQMLPLRTQAATCCIMTITCGGLCTTIIKTLNKGKYFGTMVLIPLVEFRHSLKHFMLIPLSPMCLQEIPLFISKCCQPSPRMAQFCTTSCGWVMARFHRKSSFHTFSLVMYTHAQLLPPPANGPLTQINNPNEAFQRCPQWRCHQSGTLLNFMPLCPYSHLLISFLNHLPRCWQRRPPPPPTFSSVSTVHVSSPFNERQRQLNLHHKLWQSTLLSLTY